MHTPTKEERVKIVQHLNYEMDMLGQLLLIRDSGVLSHPTIRNGLVESFAIHARNIIHFLFGSPKQDDVVALQFFAEPAIWIKIRGKQPAILRQATKRADKEVAHLTYSRLNLPDDQKVWNWDEIYMALLVPWTQFTQNMVL